MTQVTVRPEGHPDAPPPLVAASRQAASGEPVGSALKALREAQGLSLDDVSRRLKFSARMVQALEAEQWSALPQGTALRGLVRNYARLLGADPQALVQALEPQIGRARARLGESTLVTGVPRAHEPRGWVSLLWGILILAVVAVIVGYAFWQGWLPADWLPFGSSAAPASS